MIENGADEQMFKQAILDQGRGLILDTVEEIQERHKAVRRVRRLLDLHRDLFRHERSSRRYKVR